MTKRPPVVEALSVSAQHVFTGTAIELAWTVRGHERLALETPWGEVLRIEGDRLRLVPARSGAYVLRAASAFGEMAVSTDPVYVYTPPQVGFVEVPDLSGIGGIFQRMDPDTVTDILSLPGESAELWRGLSAALPTATIPVESLLPTLPPAFLPSIVDWKEFTDVIDDSFKAGTRAARKGLIRQRWRKWLSKK